MEMDMRKNKMMRLASGLLVTTLLTTSIISGTFAKYTTQDSANDTARVAKWGVTLAVEGDLYGANYLNGTQSNKNEKTEGTSNISVSGLTGSATTNVVAPGTKNDGKGFYFDIQGKPEVSTQINATITTQNIYLAAGSYGVMVNVKDAVTAENFAALKSKLYTLNSTTYSLVGSSDTYSSDTAYFELQDDVTLTGDYYPVVYTLAGDSTNGISYNDGSTSADSLSVLSAAIATQLKGSTVSQVDTDATTRLATYTVTSKTYDANTDLKTTLKLVGEQITWAWDYGTTTGTGDSAAVTDKADTILGDLIASTSGVVKMDGNDYKTLTVNSTNLVTDVSNNVVACLQTQFDINITATQVD
jgi:hypothetical protein